MPRLLTALLLLLALALPASAQRFETAARAAWIYDETTGTVLLDKNAEEALPPASMSKLMTVYMAFEALQKGTLTPEMTLPVSEHAMSYGGSTMFLNTLDRPTVWELLQGIVVLSGNDATVVIAEALSPDGTEAGFAELMNDRARELGLTQSHFENSNGWPAAGHVMSAHDLGMLAKHLIEDFPDHPEYYALFSQESFDFDGRAPANTRNRNPVLTLGAGADGLKTGHTEEAGYGLVGSAKQGDRRIIFVITGLPSMEARRTESERIINWAFRQFSVRKVGAAGSELARADVWMGAEPTVGLVLPEDLTVLIPATGDVKASIAYQGPVPAPIAAGQEVAQLVLVREGMPEMRLPLVAGSEVPRGGFVPRVQTALGVLLAQAGLGAAIPGAVPAPAAEPESPPAAGDAAAPAQGQEAQTESDAAAAPVEDGGADGTEAPEGEALQDGE